MEERREVVEAVRGREGPAILDEVEGVEEEVLFADGGIRRRAEGDKRVEEEAGEGEGRDGEGRDGEGRGGVGTG